jgi:hypothetical protein
MEGNYMKQARTEVKKLADLKPADYNPRTITDKALKGLGHSIDRFGLVEPIVWNETTGHIVGGHQRFKILTKRGVTETEVVVVNLEDSEEKALNLALNNPKTRGEFTDQATELLTRLESECFEGFEDLKLDDLKYFVERVKNAINEEKPEKKVHGKGKVGLICPKCHARWDKKTKVVFKEGSK